MEMLTLKNQIDFNFDELKIDLESESVSEYK